MKTPSELHNQCRNTKFAAQPVQVSAQDAGKGLWDCSMAWRFFFIIMTIAEQEAKPHRIGERKEIF